jgi:hypothetical protein
MKEFLLNELPEVMDNIEESTKAIYDPNAIWLEAIQFADYVQQLSSHLYSGHGEECVLDIAEQLDNMCKSFKNMGENALKVLDESEKEV